MAAEGNIIRYMITGEEGEVIPQNATHFSVHPSVTVIPEHLLEHHPNIIELICHEGVIKIEGYAFSGCFRLKRAVMLGVETLSYGVFEYCGALADVECKNLKIIRDDAFRGCSSLKGLNLTSVEEVQKGAFSKCFALAEANFSNKLKNIDRSAFIYCYSLGKITIPLRKGLISSDDTFQGCERLEQVDLVGGAALRGDAAALQFEVWRKDLIAELDSIKQDLPNAPAGETYIEDDDDWYRYKQDEGEKAEVIRGWLARVVDKIIQYRDDHCQLLDKAAVVLELASPNDNDVVVNNVLPFLQLPSWWTRGLREEKRKGPV